MKWSIRFFKLFFIDAFPTFLNKADFTKRILSPWTENLSCQTILKDVEKLQNVYFEIKDGIFVEI